jgi:hypothetical protein
MKHGFLIGVALFGLLSFVGTGSASAQRQYRRYSPPAGPTVTPYLNYFRQDTGVVGDPYNAFIVPRRQLDTQITNLAKQQKLDTDETRKQVEQFRESEAAPTGAGAGFMNYSHFYRQSTSPSRGKGR